jgi:hypothetical protein
MHAIIFVLSCLVLLHRFGHSKSLATLASWPSNESIAVQDYSEGVSEVGCLKRSLYRLRILLRDCSHSLFFYLNYRSLPFVSFSAFSFVFGVSS